MTEMHTIPEGWSETTLGKIARYVNGRAFKPSEWGSTGRPIIRIQNLTGSAQTINRYDGVVDEKHIVRRGDLLMSWAATLGVYVWQGEEAALNQHTFKVHPTVDERFMYYLLQHTLGALKAQVHGTGMQHITKSKFEATRVVIPQDRTEQERIVARIDELMGDIDAGESDVSGAVARLADLKSLVVERAVKGGFSVGQHDGQLTEDIARHIRLRAHGKRVPPIVDVSDTLFADWTLPAGWAWTSLDALAADRRNALKAGPFGSALKKSFYVPHGYKVYGQEQVIRGDATYGDYYIDEQRYESLKSCSVVPGDILVSLVGTIGRVLILPPDSEPGIINPRLLKFTLSDELVDARYIATYLRSPSVRRHLLRESHGGTMDVLNLTTLRSLPIALPPLDEQRAIIGRVDEFLSGLEHLDNDIGQVGDEARALRQSILRAAFSGEL